MTENSGDKFMPGAYCGLRSGFDRIGTPLSPPHPSWTASPTKLPETVRLDLVSAALAEPNPELKRLAEERLIAAWSETVEAFLDPRSPERQNLDAHLLGSCRLSPEGLSAGLAAVLGGVRESAFRSLLAAAASRGPSSGFVLAILAGNLPGLAVQPLAAAVALRRPALLKSPSSEPWFAKAFVEALGQREPAFLKAYSAASWTGGDRSIEGPLFARAGRILAYGDRATLLDLARRAPGKLFGYGPKTSLAVVGALGTPGVPGVNGSPTLAEVAAGLARDIALFDQRGCLSVGAVFTTLPPEELADALSAQLAILARLWPPGPAEPEALGAVQQLRLDAQMRGLDARFSKLSEGTVIIEPEPRFIPSPGLRMIRIHPLDDLSRLPAILTPWAGQLQGVALVGAETEALQPALAALGVSRFAPPGELQHPDATWHNGGVHPLDALIG